MRSICFILLTINSLRYRRSFEERGLSPSGTIIRETTCRYPVTLGDTAYNALGQLTLQVRYDTDDDEAELEFEPGKPATFFYLHEGSPKEMPHQCYVELVGDGVMTVSLPNKAAAQSLHDTAGRHPIGLQLGIDNTSFRVMTEALHDAERSDNERFSRLRDVLLGRRPPSFRSLPLVSFPWLNPSQQEAIQKTLEAQEVSIIHGPPGTGKTTTLVEAVIETLQRETQVLVCAPSNAAVDWISEQLMRRGIHVLRVGNPLRMSDEMLDCSYERRYAAHPDYHELWSIRRTLREGAKGEQAHRLRNRETELEIKINADLFEQASVVSCTLIGSAYRLMERRHFSTRQFVLIIGSDNWLQFDRWVRPEEIMAHHEILVYPRRGYDIEPSTLPSGVTLTDTPYYDISSTAIRDAIRNNPAYNGEGLAPKVWEAIQQFGYYKEKP